MSETNQQTTGEQETQDGQRKKALMGIGLGVGLVVVLFMGGKAIAWALQGPLFYDEKAFSLQATVVGNAQGALGIDERLVVDESAKANFVDTRHWLVLSYPECEGALQGFWIPDAPKSSAKQAGLLNQLRVCYLPIKAGEKVPVEILSRQKRSSGEKTWRVQSINGCDARQLETLLNPKPDSARCSWM